MDHPRYRPLCLFKNLAHPTHIIAWTRQWFSCNWLHYKIDPKKKKTLSSNIICAHSCYCNCFVLVLLQYRSTNVLPAFLLVCPWPNPYFFQKRWMMPRHTLNPYYGWFRLVLFSKVSNFKPETCIPVLGSSFNFKEPPNSSSLNISESKNHWFSSLKKKSRIKRTTGSSYFKKPQRIKWFSLKKSSKELMVLGPIFLTLFFF
jgi:hypothetical protein